jgi:hypothetical protein
MELIYSYETEQKNLLQGGGLRDRDSGGDITKVQYVYLELL